MKKELGPSPRKARRVTGCYCLVFTLFGGCVPGHVSPEASDDGMHSRQAVSGTSDSNRLEPPPLQDPVEVRAEGMAALQSGDVKTAYRLARSSLKAAPDDPQGRFLMALVLGEMHRFHEAIKMLDDLVHADPAARLPVLGQTAEWLVTMGQWETAEQRYRAVLDEVPDAVLVHRGLSQLLLRQGRRIEAAGHLRQLVIAGDVSEAELRVLLMISRPFSGEDVIEEFEPIGPLGRARYLIGKGDWTGAKAELSMVKMAGRDEVDLLGRVNASLADFTSLEAWATSRPTDQSPTADAWFAQGVLAIHQNRYLAATRCFCEAVILDPTDTEAYLELSKSLASMGNEAAAILAAERVGLLSRTQQIGKEMTENGDRDPRKLAELATLLDQLRRPFESLAWRAVEIAYAQPDVSPADARERMADINRSRSELLQVGGFDPPEDFLVCNVDIATLRRQDDLSRASGNLDGL